MPLSKLSVKCAHCPNVDSCDHKRMEAVGFLKPTTAKADVELQESMLVPHDYRQVKIAPNTTVTIDLEDMKKEIEKSIAKYAGLYGGYFNNCS